MEKLIPLTHPRNVMGWRFTVYGVPVGISVHLTDWAVWRVCEHCLTVPVLPGAVAVRASINLTETVFPPGSEIRIPCDVSGYPVPRVTWYKDGVPLQTADRRRVQGQWGQTGHTGLHRAHQSFVMDINLHIRFSSLILYMWNAAKV